MGTVRAVQWMQEKEELRRENERLKAENERLRAENVGRDVGLREAREIMENLAASKTWRDRIARDWLEKYGAKCGANPPPADNLDADQGITGKD